MHQLNRLRDRKPGDPTHSRNSQFTRPLIQNLREVLTGSYFLQDDRRSPIGQEAQMVEIRQHRNFENATMSSNSNTRRTDFDASVSTGSAVEFTWHTRSGRNGCSEFNECA